MQATLIHPKDLGRELRMLRFACEWSAREVQDRLGGEVSESTLLRWEKGAGRFPDPMKLAMLAELYGGQLHVGIKVSDLLDPYFDTRVWLNAAA